ncbi:hypothetical protein ANN_17660 [Periplaneta americana]|uniref:Tc1-like transposase DDE domain-containing protein n=1 Tax=Periplaneta americana TaxID=6978 RepID=A0ABQ8STJ6_PERAM|nr:hypothetical protein ANN_17660 [Periplaneta americana]
MNSINFEKCFQEHVLPNLPPASVIVMDNASYHSREVEKTPSRKVQEQEEEYWKRGSVMEIAVDQVLISTTSADTSDEDDSSEDRHSVDNSD